jgi:choline dehydrogenase-like flavoprotein
MVRNWSDGDEQKTLIWTYTAAFEKLGNKGWNWDTLKAYYKKAERLLPPNAKDDVTNFDIREHGLDGAFRLFSFTPHLSIWPRSGGGGISCVAIWPREAFC